MIITIQLSYLLLALISLFCNKRNIAVVKYLYLIISVLFTVVLSLRGMNIPDTVPYYECFTDPSVFEGYFEKGYLWINYLLTDLIDFRAYLLFISLLSVISWHYCIRKISSSINIFIAMSIFTSFMGVFYWGIILRASIGMLFVFLGYTWLNETLKSKFIFVTCILIGGFFHQSVYVFLVIPLIYSIKLSNKVLYIILFCTLFMGSLNIVPVLVSKITFLIDILGVKRLGSYISRDTNLENVSLSVTFIKHFLLSIFFIHVRRKIRLGSYDIQLYNILLYTYVLGTFVYYVFSFVQSGSRIAMLFLYFEFILMGLIIPTWSVNVFKKVILVMLVVIVNIFALFSKVPQLYNFTLL